MSPRPLQLDYVALPRRPRLVGFALFAIAIVAAGVLVERYREVRLELDAIEARQGLLSGERRPARATPPERLEEEAKNAEAVLRQLALPWGGIIESLEDAATQDVAIVQMQPDAQLRQLRLGAEARTYDAMIQYLRRLVAAKSLADAHIVSHQVQMDDPRRPVRFTVQASLIGAP